MRLGGIFIKCLCLHFVVLKTNEISTSTEITTFGVHFGQPQELANVIIINYETDPTQFYFWTYLSLFSPPQRNVCEPLIVLKIKMENLSAYGNMYHVKSDGYCKIKASFLLAAISLILKAAGTKRVLPKHALFYS